MCCANRNALIDITTTSLLACTTSVGWWILANMAKWSLDGISPQFRMAANSTIADCFETGVSRSLTRSLSTAPRTPAHANAPLAARFRVAQLRGSAAGRQPPIPLRRTQPACVAMGRAVHNSAAHASKTPASHHTDDETVYKDAPDRRSRRRARSH